MFALVGLRRAWCNRLRRHRQTQKQKKVIHVFFDAFLSSFHGFNMWCDKLNNVCTVMTNYWYVRSNMIVVYIFLVPSYLRDKTPTREHIQSLTLQFIHCSIYVHHIVGIEFVNTSTVFVCFDFSILTGFIRFMWIFTLLSITILLSFCGWAHRFTHNFNIFQFRKRQTKHGYQELV